MQNSFSATALAVLTLPFFYLHAVFAEPLATLSPSAALIETMDKDVKVSGAFVAGAAFAGAKPLKKRPSLRTLIPAEWADKTVCMQARSIDGAYRARAEYTVPDDWSLAGVVDLEYRTAHADVLAQSGENGDRAIAVVLYEGRCEDDPSRLLIAYWNTEDNAAKLPIKLYINSLAADDVFVFVGEDPAAKAILCPRIDRADLVAFDRICTLTADMQPLDGQVRIEINAARSGVRDPARFVDLVLPMVGSEE